MKTYYYTQEEINIIEAAARISEKLKSDYDYHCDNISLYIRLMEYSRAIQWYNALERQVYNTLSKDKEIDNDLKIICENLNKFCK